MRYVQAFVSDMTPRSKGNKQYVGLNILLRFWKNLSATFSIGSRNRSILSADAQRATLSTFACTHITLQLVVRFSAAHHQPYDNPTCTGRREIYSVTSVQCPSIQVFYPC